MKRMRFLGAALAAIVVAGGGSLAVADPWGNQSGTTGAHPDEDPHTYCFAGNVPADLRPNIDNAAFNALDPTQANVNFQGSCVLSGASETDAVFQNVNLAPGVTGVTPCDDYESNPPTNQCDQYDVQLDYAQINVGAEDEIDQTQTACHELGHSVGLSHGANLGCMISTGDTPPTALRYRRYDPNHHIPDHINPWF